MCLRGRTGAAPATMGFDLFREILERDFDYPHFLLLYGQGEPLLCPDLFEMIRWERERGRFVVTVTNGTLLDDRACAEVARSGLDLLRVSIDGAEAGTYERVRPGASFDQVLGNLERLRARLERERGRTQLAVTFMALRDNALEMPAMVRLVAGLGIRMLEIKEVPRYRDERQAPLSWAMEQDAELARAVESALRAANQEASRRGVRLVTARFGPQAGRPPCLNPWFKTFVAADGRVSPCSKLCLVPEAEVGRLTHEPFDAVWHGERYQRLRRCIAAGGVAFDACRWRTDAAEPPQRTGLYSPHDLPRRRTLSQRSVERQV
jgi:MoaA/NifB/PqqE/SkfB family radical SAM enzyme